MVDAAGFEQIVRYQSPFLFLSRITDFDVQTLSNQINDLKIDDYSGNQKDIKEIDFSRFRELRSLCIGYWSFLYVSKVQVINLPNIVAIDIKPFAFSKSTGIASFCCIQNCPVLEKSIFGAYSFTGFRILTLQSSY